MKRRHFLRTAAVLLGAPARPQSVARQPTHNVRSIQRLFTSEAEDKPWFDDRDMWPHYLGMLAENQFNRLNLSFGIGYAFLRKLTALPKRANCAAVNSRPRILPITRGWSLALIGSASARTAGETRRSECRGTFDKET